VWCGKVFFHPQKNLVWPTAIHDCWKYQVPRGPLCIKISS
jgi:hypothetical protein